MRATQQFGTRPSAPNLIRAWLVHLYTATGALAAFFGTLAIIDERYRAAFLIMIAATVIDSTDGLAARRARVAEVLPDFDGSRLDDIVDYLTFVFVPVLLLFRCGALPAGWGPVVASFVLLGSAYGFAKKDAKTSDQFFTGFPSYWNVVALYLYAARLPPVLNATILLVLTALIFVRVGYVYPSRTPVLRNLTVSLGAAWGVLLLIMTITLPDVPPAVLFVSLLYPLYYAVLSFVLHVRRARGAASPL